MYNDIRKKGGDKMKLRHKFLNPIAVYFIVYVFGLWLLGFSLEAVEWVYAYLNHLMPETFPLYNPIYDPEAHARLNRILTVIGMFAVLFLINFISLKVDNKKYERIIILTDGQYLIHEGVRLYFKEFWISDIISALILPALLVIPPYFIPENVLGKFGLIVFTWLGYHMSKLYSLIPAIFIVAIFSFVGRLLAIRGAVKSWRAAWLSDI